MSINTYSSGRRAVIIGAAWPPSTLMNNSLDWLDYFSRPTYFPPRNMVLDVSIRSADLVINAELGETYLLTNNRYRFGRFARLKSLPRPYLKVSPFFDTSRSDRDTWYRHRSIMVQTDQNLLAEKFRTRRIDRCTTRPKNEWKPTTNLFSSMRSDSPESGKSRIALNPLSRTFPAVSSFNSSKWTAHSLDHLKAAFIERTRSLMSPQKSELPLAMKNNFLSVFTRILMTLIPGAYRKDAKELIQSAPNAERCAVAWDCAIGGIRYNIRKVWLPLLAFVYCRMRTSFAGSGSECSVSSAWFKKE